MSLINLIAPLNLNITPSQQWHIFGPAADTWANIAGIITVADNLSPEVGSLLLPEILSYQEEPAAWLIHLLAPLAPNTRLVVIDWQTDGPLEPGPPLECRFNRGRLSRLLREAGFGAVETVVSQASYYVVQAVKAPVPSHPQAGTFVPVATLAELPKNTMKRVNLFGETLIVANTGKEIVAFAQACPHATGRLDEGRLRGRNVVCPVHYYIWNVQSGEPVMPGDEDILPRYAVRVDHETGQVFVAPDRI